MKIYRILLCLLVIFLACTGTATAFAEESQEVYLGGYAVGLSSLGQGLYVDGFGYVTTESGEVSPFENSGVKVGDVLLKVNGKDVNDRDQVQNALKVGKNELTIISDGEKKTVFGNSVFDLKSEKLKLGLYLSTTVDGVGTISFVKKNKDFCALGHAVTTQENGTPVQIYKGEIFPCEIINVVKSQKNDPGQLNGAVDKSKIIGKITKNQNLGIYGKMNSLPKTNLITVAKREEVKSGEAKILSTIDGDEPKEYSCEIIKAEYQPTVAEKGLTVKITDKELIEKCGGITRGMSGSPIIQSGKLVGVLTHVFISDPLKGYGVYAEFLTDN